MHHDDAYSSESTSSGRELPDRKACDHDWVDARNPHVVSGCMCRKCHALWSGICGDAAIIAVPDSKAAEDLFGELPAYRTVATDHTQAMQVEALASENPAFAELRAKDARIAALEADLLQRERWHRESQAKIAALEAEVAALKRQGERMARRP